MKEIVLELISAAKLLIEANKVGSYLFVAMLNGFLLLKIAGWFFDWRKKHLAYVKLYESQRALQEEIQEEYLSLLRRSGVRINSERTAATTRREVESIMGLSNLENMAENLSEVIRDGNPIPFREERVMGDGFGEALPVMPDMNDPFLERTERVSGMDVGNPGGSRTIIHEATESGVVFHEVDVDGRFTRLNTEGERTEEWLSAEQLAELYRAEYLAEEAGCAEERRVENTNLEVEADAHSDGRIRAASINRETLQRIRAAQSEIDPVVAEAIDTIAGFSSQEQIEQARELVRRRLQEEEINQRNSNASDIMVDEHGNVGRRLSMESLFGNNQSRNSGQKVKVAETDKFMKKRRFRTEPYDRFSKIRGNGRGDHIIDLSDKRKRIETDRYY